MAKSKGQVTVFVIIGIVIVAAVVTAYFFSSQVLKSGWEREREKAASVPSQAQLIKTHVESCVKEVAEQGARLLGAQSGYIDIPEDLTVRNPLNPFSNSVELGGGAEVPYWYYENSAGIQREQVPSISQMQIELESYLDNNLNKCFNYEQFGEQGYSVQAGRPISSVEIDDDQVLVSVDYPVDLDLRDFEFKFEKFYEKVDIPLGRLYEIALDILETENREMFLENKTLDDMIVYDEIPFSGVDFDCSPRTWTKSQVVTSLKNILETNLAYIKIENTDYILSDQSHRYYEVDAGVSGADVGVNFLYSADWPTYIEVVSHKDKELLRGEPYTLENAGAAYLASLFCLNQYHFVYDIKYPVVVILSDGDYIFQFGLMSIIDNNQARENRVSIDYNYDTEIPICDKGVVDTKVYALAPDVAGRLTQVQGARINYKCINTVCQMGVTGNDGLETKFPLCINGFVQAEREGYWIGEEQLSTTSDSIVSVIMDKIYELNLDVRLITSSGDVRNLAANEKIVFTLQNLDNDYVANAVWPGSETIKLTSGIYAVSSQVMLEDTKGIKVPASQVETCTEVPRPGILGLIGSTKKECRSTTIEGTTLTNALIGGANFDWSVSAGQLATGNTVLLYSFRDKVPNTLEEVGQISQNIKTNSQNPNFRKPEIR
ncbi:MAG: hypothetical protein Q8R00_03210 [Candidatus Nanoarchaeia archaeon]|nr:hypothetical protein [Candidatus Nanoarchaeia archaeon]